jgi:hypothetical protein
LRGDGSDVMAQILQFVRPENSFDPETLAILSAAYDKAIVGLHDSGQPEIVREIIAKKIIALAMKGERDADRLCASALAAITRPQ